MGDLIEDAKGLAKRNAGFTAAAGLSFLASFLINLPEALEGYYRLIAVSGGLAGYWTSSAQAFGRMKIALRFFISLFSIFAVAIAALYLRWYFDQSLTSLFHDGLAMISFGASFSAVCLFMGLCGISVVVPPTDEAES